MPVIDPFSSLLHRFSQEWEQSKSECDASAKKEEKAMMRAWRIQQGLFSVIFLPDTLNPEG